MVDISIIIPAFNRLWALPEALESCRGSQCAVEIIVVDDGSTDGTWDWLQTQPDVVAIRQSNWGKDNAVNRAFAQAQGEYVRFLDSDDLIAPGANDAQLAAARAADADIVVAGYVGTFEGEARTEPHPWIDCDDFIAQQLGERDSSHYSAYLFRRAFIADIPHRQEFAYRDDRMFVIEAALKEPRVARVDMPCLFHRHHKNERIQFRLGATSVVTYWQEWLMFRKAARMLEESGRLTERRKRAIAHSVWPIAHRLAATHMREALDALAWVRELDPDFEIPADSGIGKVYRLTGFRAGAYAFRAARLARGLLSDVSGRKPYTPK